MLWFPWRCHVWLRSDDRVRTCTGVTVSGTSELLQALYLTETGVSVWLRTTGPSKTGCCSTKSSFPLASNTNRVFKLCMKLPLCLIVLYYYLLLYYIICSVHLLQNQDQKPRLPQRVTSHIHTHALHCTYTVTHRWMHRGMFGVR